MFPPVARGAASPLYVGCWHQAEKPMVPIRSTSDPKQTLNQTLHAGRHLPPLQLSLLR
jgi:hypothetical protein